MKKQFLIFFTLTCTGIITFAGNNSKSGQAGAGELLINSWTRSAGWNAVNASGIRGIEAMNTNVAGIAFTKRLEVVFSHTDWISGWDMNIYTFGFSAKAGESGVLGFSIFAMDLGEFIETTTALPEGTGNTFSPQFLNVALAYSKAFSRRIYGGALLRVISEAIPNASANGVALDAGIQYVTGEKEQLKLGISIRNLGPEMSFTGEGLTYSGRIPGVEYDHSLNQRSQAFEIPSQLNIGGSYDFLFGESHRVTFASRFTSNSFTKDQTGAGLEYGFKTYLMLRAGFNYEQGIFNDPKINDFDNTRTNAMTGLALGATIEIPFGKEKASSFGLDYAYRATDPFDGIHNIGVRINL